MQKGDQLLSDNHSTYHLDDSNADIYARDIKIDNGSYHFEVVIKDYAIENVVLNMGGLHNIENVIAAIAVAYHLGVDEDKIVKAVVNFKGVKRRFEYIVKEKDHVFIDDYAHHPEELRALITGAKGLFKNKKSTIVFQPHLYTRTRDFVDGFAEVLDMADEVILLPIYPARELPIEGVNSEMILSKIKNKNKKIISKEELKDWIKNNKTELLITAGAGDIDMLVQPIKEIIKKQ